MGIDELKFRKALCEKFIQIISEMDDPRKEEALEEYNRQLETIKAKIAELEPEPVIVSLKSATLTGITKPVGE